MVMETEDLVRLVVVTKDQEVIVDQQTLDVMIMVEKATEDFHVIKIHVLHPLVMKMVVAILMLHHPVRVVAVVVVVVVGLQT